MTFLEPTIDRVLITAKKTNSLPLLMVCMVLWGCYLFFLNHSIPEYFQDRPGGVELYAIFSSEIFQPNSLYIAESLLVPLLANFLGAEASLQSYRILCAIATVSILPALLFAGSCNRKSLARPLIVLFVFSITFKYFWAYQLGFPDPVTICLLCLLVLQTRPFIQLVLVTLAGLSHFSMVFLAVASLCICVFFQPTEKSKSDRIKFIKIVVLGLCISKFILLCWGFVFRYQIDSRLGHVLDSGLAYFLSRYTANPFGFWNTPGWANLSTVAILIFYFLVRKQWKFSLAMLASLAIAYMALFITTDGLRVFAVILAPSYFFSLSQIVDDIHRNNIDFIKSCNIRMRDCWFRQKDSVFRWLGGLLVGVIWLFWVYRAKERGWLLNQVDFLNITVLQLRVYDYVLLGSALVLTVSIISKRIQQVLFLVRFVKFSVTAVLLLCLYQFVRQQNLSWFPVSLAGQIAVMGLMVILAIVVAMANLQSKFKLGSEQMLDYFDLSKKID